MAKAIKRKSSFGTVTVNHFSPPVADGWPKAINVTLSFEEVLKLHLGLGQVLGRLNEYNRSTTGGPPLSGQPLRLHGREEGYVRQMRVW
jgi:hypothetical protein